ncbi:hypothetical protein [Nocardia heshunensis]
MEIDRAERHAVRPDSVIGVDVGVKSLAVLSDGEMVDMLRARLRTYSERFDPLCASLYSRLVRGSGMCIGVRID